MNVRDMPQQLHSLVLASKGQADAAHEVATALYRAQLVTPTVDAATFDKIVETAANAMSLLDPMAQREKAGQILRTILSAAAEEKTTSPLDFTERVRAACKSAAQSYDAITDYSLRFAAEYGMQLAGELDAWMDAQEILVHAAELKRSGVGQLIDTSGAEGVLVEMRGKMTAFEASYDAMLRGEKAVSEVFGNAAIFALFPSLRGLDLPGLYDKLAGQIEFTDPQLFLGLFSQGWLGTFRAWDGPGPLPGGLNRFVAQLRADATKLRRGCPLVTQGTDTSGLDARDYRTIGTRDDGTTASGFGLIPSFLFAVSAPATARASFIQLETGKPWAMPTYLAPSARPASRQPTLLEQLLAGK